MEFNSGVAMKTLYDFYFVRRASLDEFFGHEGFLEIALHWAACDDEKAR
jgi:hypothetical protein